MRARRLLKYFTGLMVLAIVVAVSIAVGWKMADQRSYAAHNRYPLLDPSVNNPSVHQEIINFDPLRQNLKAYLARLNVDHSLYFEYLPNGINIRDGDDNVSQAASLIKAPLVMDLYKLAEQGKLNLDNQSTVEPVDINTDPLYGNPTGLKAGDKISLRQAAQITLKYSDNTTLNVIKDRILPLVDSTSDSFRSLDLSYTVGGLADNEQLSISARSYASVLKCLYYACFNTPQDSTQIITYLMNSADPNRLAAGVPAGIKVAHKVGSGGAPAQSDCGIIYYPAKPYLICLMFFKISNSTASAQVDSYFKTVSQMIYQYIANTGGS